MAFSVSSDFSTLLVLPLFLVRHCKDFISLVSGLKSRLNGTRRNGSKWSIPSFLYHISADRFSMTPFFRMTGTSVLVSGNNLFGLLLGIEIGLYLILKNT